MSDPGLLIYVNGRLLPRAEAMVSVFDAGFQSGDGVWETFRIYGGRVFQLAAHINRLFDSAKAVDLDLGMSPEEIREALFATLRANGLHDNAHVRLMVTRGERRTSGMDPRLALGKPTFVLIAEHKPPIFDKAGLRLVTASTRRPSPDALDPKIHHSNQLNSILAKIESNRAGADDALMLDQQGFVAESCTANIFIVKHDQISTPFANACLHGITRGLVLRLARDAGIPIVERDISLLEVHTADEVFLTGTIGEIVPVIQVDGRTIGTGEPGPVTERVSELHRALTLREGTPIPDA